MIASPTPQDDMVAAIDRIDDFVDHYPGRKYERSNLHPEHIYGVWDEGEEHPLNWSDLKVAVELARNYLDLCE